MAWRSSFPVFAWLGLLLRLRGRRGRDFKWVGVGWEEGWGVRCGVRRDGDSGKEMGEKDVVGK